MSSVRPRVAQYAAIEAVRTDFPTPPFPLAMHSEAARTTPLGHAPAAERARFCGDPSCGAWSRLSSRRAWFQCKRVRDERTGVLSAEAVSCRWW